MAQFWNSVAHVHCISQSFSYILIHVRFLTHHIILMWAPVTTLSTCFFTKVRRQGVITYKSPRGTRHKRKIVNGFDEQPRTQVRTMTQAGWYKTTCVTCFILWDSDRQHNSSHVAFLNDQPKKKEAHLMSFHVQYVDTVPVWGHNVRTVMRMVGWIQPMCMSFLCSTSTHSKYLSQTDTSCSSWFL